MIARTTSQHVTKNEAATDYFQRNIGNYHKSLAGDFSQGDHYAINLDGLEGFTNDDVPNLHETYKEAYNGTNSMINVDGYVNNSEDVEAAAHSYDTYIGEELNFVDSERNAVYGRVNKQVRKNGGQAVDVVNRNPLLDTSKYKVEYIDGYIEK